MIDHDVVRLYISVHYSFAVAKVECLYPCQYKRKHISLAKYLEELKYVIPDIIIDEFRVEAAEVGIVHVFEYQARRFALYHV